MAIKWYIVHRQSVFTCRFGKNAICLRSKGLIIMLLLLLASKLWIMSTSWRTFSKVGWLYLFWMKDADIHVHMLDSTITTEQCTSAGLLYQFCFYIVHCYFMRLVPLLSTGLHWSWVDKYIMRMTGKKFIIASARSENSLWLKCYCNQKSILLFLCISKLFVTKPLSDWRFLSLHFKKTPVYFDWNFPY